MVRYKYKSDYLWSIKYLSAPLQASIFRYIELDGTELVELVASSTKALWDVGQLYTYFYFFCMNSQTVSSGNRSYLTASHHNRPCLTHFCLEWHSGHNNMFNSLNSIITNKPLTDNAKVLLPKQHLKPPNWSSRSIIRHTGHRWSQIIGSLTAVTVLAFSPRSPYPFLYMFMLTKMEMRLQSAVSTDRRQAEENGTTKRKCDHTFPIKL